MKQKLYDKSEMEFDKNSLTEVGDWDQYYSGRTYALIEKAAGSPSLIDHYLSKESGKIFELGCGGSPFLLRAAMYGWEVGGIDFNAKAVDLICHVLSQRGFMTKNFICNDIFSYNCSQLYNQYDLLMSFGFLEHFHTPEIILSKWKRILKHKGKVISIIPNLYSINSYFFKKYDYKFWSEHTAQFMGYYDIHMLIPWDKIKQRINRVLFFKIIKIFAFYCIGQPLALITRKNKNIRLLNSYVMGVYVQPEKDGLG